MSDTPAWSQVATQQDLQQLRQELKHLKWTLYGLVILTAAWSDRAAALFEYIRQGL